MEEAILEGYANLARAVIAAAVNDFRTLGGTSPKRAVQLARKPGDSLPAFVCRFALGLGFETPRQEVLSFFKRKDTWDMLSWLGVDPQEFLGKVGVLEAMDGGPT